MRNQYKVLQEAYNQVDSQHNEVQQIVNTCRGIVQGYLKLLNNKKISGAQLADYVQKKTNPMLEYIGSYIVHSTPQEKAKFINYLKELLTTNWLEVDEQYWLEEMNKLVKGAVEYGEVNLDNLDDLVKEDDKEDIMTGLDELSELPKVVYGAMVLYSRTKFFSDTLGEVMEKFFDETSLNYFSEWTPAGYPPPNIEELKLGLATEGVYVLYGEDYEVVFASDRDTLNTKVAELRQQQF